MLLKYEKLKNTNIDRINSNSVIYEHEGMSYGLKANCKITKENNGYRISPDSIEFELCLLRLGKKG